jgi:AraC-like DNA-binding protein
MHLGRVRRQLDGRLEHDDPKGAFVDGGGARGHPMRRSVVATGRSELMLRIGATLAVPAVLQELGASPGQVLAEAGFDLALFDNPGNQISYLARGHLLEHCARATGCPHFGLLVGESAGLDSLGLVGLPVMYPHDVGTALGQLVRYVHLRVRGAVPTLAVEGGYAVVAYQVYRLGAQGNDQTGDGAVAAMFNIMRTLCGSDFQPTEAWFARRRPEKVEPYRKFFQVFLRFDADQNALVFSSTWLNRLLPNADTELRRLLQEQIGALEQQHGPDFPEQVRSVLRAALATGHAKADHLAELFSMRVRTLHRRLTEHGTSYQQLLDEARFEVARQLLLHSAKDMAEIAGLLDYGDARSFIRAFRRWSGTTPARWRNDEVATGRSNSR